MLAQVALQNNMYQTVTNLIEECPKHLLDPRLGVYRDLIESELSLYLNEDSSEVNVSARMNALRNVARVVESAAQYGVEEVVLEGSVILWNIMQPIIEDRNRPLLVAIIRSTTKALETVDSTNKELEFCLQHELSKSYEALNLLSLARTHSKLAENYECSIEQKDENMLAKSRIKAKLHSLSSNLPLEIKALTFVDRAKMGLFEDAIHFLDRSIKIVSPVITIDLLFGIYIYQCEILTNNYWLSLGV